MAKPRQFLFAIPEGDPVRLSEALHAIVRALEPLTEAECAHVLSALPPMYEAPPKVAPEGGCIVKCPVCTRIGPFFKDAGETIGNCAQCALGEGRRVPLVIDASAVPHG